MNKNDTKYYYKDANGQTQGALSENELKELNLSSKTPIWHKGLSDWTDYGVLFPSPQIKRKTYWLWIIVGAIALICALFYVTWACSTHNRLLTNSYASEEFDIYINKYYRDLEVFGISIVKPRRTSIRFAPMQYFEDTKDYYGLCYGYDNDDIIEIYINEDAWEKLNRSQKYLIMYHELSHDLLNVDDLPNTYNNQGKLMCPVLNRFEELTMDDFIEISHDFFIEQSPIYSY